jgi:hypothetical protein
MDDHVEQTAVEIPLQIHRGDGRYLVHIHPPSRVKIGEITKDGITSNGKGRACKGPMNRGEEGQGRPLPRAGGFRRRGFYLDAVDKA